MRIPPRTGHQTTTPRNRHRLVVGVVLVTGCASSGASEPPPPTVTINRIASGSENIVLINEPGVGSRVLAESRARIWRTLPAVYERLDIPLVMADPRSWEIGNPGYRARRVEGERLSTYLDCGQGLTGARADDYDVTLSVITQLTSSSADSTLVRTIVDASAKARATSGNPVHCASRGRLEQRVAQLLVEELREY